MSEHWLDESAQPSFVPLTADCQREPRVAVIGAGAVGLTAAHDLAVGGAEVTVFERETIAAGATGRAAGLCYDAFAEDVDAAVGARSIARFRALDRQSADEMFGFHETPYVMLAREDDEENIAAIETSVPRMRTHGRDVSLVDPEELATQWPIRTDDIATAAIARDAGWADPTAYAEAMAIRAQSDGVTIEEQTSVKLAEKSTLLVDGETRSFDAVIVAAGAQTTSLLASAEIQVPLAAYRAQALVGRGAYDGPMCFDATRHLYFRPHPSGVLAGDGVRPKPADPDDWDPTADDSFVDSLQEQLHHRISEADVDVAETRFDIERAWAGLCTATPDGDPVVGEIDDGLYVAAGWQGHGFMRAPAIGEVVAAHVLGVSDRLPDPLGGANDPFDPSRFEGTESVNLGFGMATDE